MKIHRVGANSPEWMALRTSVPTASEFDNLLTPAKLEMSKSIGDYVAEKLACKWLGHPLQSFVGNGDTDQGKVREREALPWLALDRDIELDPPNDPDVDPQCLFVTNEIPAIPPDVDPSQPATMGCSPDSLILGRECGIEAKCPKPDTHVGWLLADVLPREHMLQVQGSMLVTGFDVWLFLSYCPHFPAFVVEVKRDLEVCAKLEDAIRKYWEKFNAGWAMLLDANGGKEPVREYETTYGPGGEIIQTLKREFLTNDPIGEILDEVRR